MDTNYIARFINRCNSIRHDFTMVNGSVCVSNEIIEEMAKIGLLILFHGFLERPIYSLNSEITNLEFLHGIGNLSDRSSKNTYILGMEALSHNKNAVILRGSGFYHSSLSRIMELKEMDVVDYKIARYDYYKSVINGQRTSIRKFIKYEDASKDVIMNNMLFPCYTFDKIDSESANSLRRIVNNFVSFPNGLSNRELAVAESVVSYFIEKLEDYILSGEYTVLCDRKTALRARSIALSEDGIPIVLHTIGRVQPCPVSYTNMLHMSRNHYKSHVEFISESFCKIASSIYRNRRNKEIINAVSYYHSGLKNIAKIRNMHNELSKRAK